jgi:glucose-1-phosphate thymidylyltransferase
MMKGVILAGGLGTRLHPVTFCINKHLLPVYKKPMIYYPIKMMESANITEIVIVISPEHAEDFSRVIFCDDELKTLKISFAYQERPNGIAGALYQAKDFVGQEKMIVALGDNIFQENITNKIGTFSDQSKGARIFLKQVDLPRQAGYAKLDGNRITDIIEKPDLPPSDKVVVGLYMYPPDAFDIIPTLKPSPRGELEITALNRAYIDRGELEYDDIDGWWIDAGESMDSLFRANLIVAKNSGYEF